MAGNLVTKFRENFGNNVWKLFADLLRDGAIPEGRAAPITARLRQVIVRRRRWRRRRQRPVR